MTDLRRSIMKRMVRSKGFLLQSPKLSRGLLHAFGYERTEAGAFCDHAANILPPVFPASYNEVAKPKSLDEDRLLLRAPLPEICPFVFKNMRISPDCGMLQAKDAFLFWPKELEQKHRFRREVGGRSVPGVNDVYFEIKSRSRLEKGLFATAPGATNWYHWLIEILPTVMLMQNLPKAYDDYPLLVPEEILSGGVFRETLDLFIGTRPMIGLARDAKYYVGEMVVIPPPVFGPFNLHDHEWPVPEDYVNNIGVMQQFRMQTLDRLGVTYDGNGPKCVFLARPPGKRAYNQEDILEVARARGFEVMYPERLSFREQVQIMHNADFVAGPSGAAWANSLFMRPGTKSLVWVFREYDGACFFSNLGHVAGCQTTYCFVDADEPINSTYKAHEATYVLCPQVFADHLDVLLP